MRKVIKPDDLTIDELRQLMVNKKRKVRLERIEHFRKTGRVVSLASDQDIPPFEHLHSETQTVQDFSEQSLRVQKNKRILDSMLLTIEILAVIGLFIVIYNAIHILRNLNTQFAQSLIPPTLTPTALIVPVVLPSGHTPPDSPGGAQPNDSEIPHHLLPLYQSYAQLPIPTSGPEQAIEIQIPQINVDAPIVQGDGWEQLKKGVAQHVGSANPGQAGNIILSAHNDVFGEIFRYLDQLEPGDKIVIYSPQNSYTYIVTNVQVVEPTNIEVMESTPDPTITLISCYPYMRDKQRIIVQGSLENDS